MSRITEQKLTDITPKILGALPEEGAYSLITFRDYLYLAAIYQLPDQLPVYSKIIRGNLKGRQWDVVYEAILLDDLEMPEDGDFWEFGLDDFTAKTLGEESQETTGYLKSKMVLFPENNSENPLLYVSFQSPFSSQLLCSEDGETYKSVSPLDCSGIFFTSGFLTFQNRLHALPLKLAPSNKSQIELMPLIHVSENPELGKWQKINIPSFGDSSNQAISAIAVYNDSLYAGTLNTERGFQIWKTQSSLNFPYSWESVLVNGAYRYALNQLVLFMVAFKGDLYVASGVSSANNQTEDIEPAGFELLRLYPDNDWDLIFGIPKFTPQGLKVPLTAKGPGLDDPNNRVIQCLTVHDGLLYLGFQKIDGFQLWTTDDGENWSQISGNQLSNYYQVSVWDTLSTSSGLILGLTIGEPNMSKILQIWLCE